MELHEDLEDVKDAKQRVIWKGQVEKEEAILVIAVLFAGAGSLLYIFLK
jgi:4-hydroxybenzoate polyprenyltransferase